MPEQSVFEMFREFAISRGFMLVVTDFALDENFLAPESFEVRAPNGGKYRISVEAIS